MAQSTKNDLLKFDFDNLDNFDSIDYDFEIDSQASTSNLNSKLEFPSTDRDCISSEPVKLKSINKETFSSTNPNFVLDANIKQSENYSNINVEKQNTSNYISKISSNLPTQNFNNQCRKKFNMTKPTFNTFSNNILVSQVNNSSANVGKHLISKNLNDDASLPDNQKNLISFINDFNSNNGKKQFTRVIKEPNVSIPTDSFLNVYDQNNEPKQSTRVIEELNVSLPTASFSNNFNSNNEQKQSIRVIEESNIAMPTDSFSNVYEQNNEPKQSTRLIKEPNVSIPTDSFPNVYDRNNEPKQSTRLIEEPHVSMPTDSFSNVFNSNNEPKQSTRLIEEPHVSTPTDSFSNVFNLNNEQKQSTRVIEEANVSIPTDSFSNDFNSNNEQNQSIKLEGKQQISIPTNNESKITSSSDFQGKTFGSCENAADIIFGQDFIQDNFISKDQSLNTKTNIAFQQNEDLSPFIPSDSLQIPNNNNNLYTENVSNIKNKFENIDASFLTLQNENSSNINQLVQTQNQFKISDNATNSNINTTNSLNSNPQNKNTSFPNFNNSTTSLSNNRNINNAENLNQHFKPQPLPKKQILHNNNVNSKTVNSLQPPSSQIKPTLSIQQQKPYITSRTPHTRFKTTIPSSTISKSQSQLSQPYSHSHSHSQHQLKTKKPLVRFGFGGQIALILPSNHSKNTLFLSKTNLITNKKELKFQFGPLKKSSLEKNSLNTYFNFLFTKSNTLKQDLNFNFSNFKISSFIEKKVYENENKTFMNEKEGDKQLLNQFFKLCIDYVLESKHHLNSTDTKPSNSQISSNKFLPQLINLLLPLSDRLISTPTIYKNQIKTNNCSNKNQDQHQNQDPKLLLELQNLCIRGQLEDACNFALTHEFQTHAIIISSQFTNPSFYQSIIQKFNQKFLQKTELNPLKNFYTLLSNKNENQNFEYFEDKKIENQNKNDLILNQKSNLAILLSNRVLNFEKQILNLGNALNSFSKFEAACLCYCCIGCEPFLNLDKEKNGKFDLILFQLTELYRFCRLNGLTNEILGLSKNSEFFNQRNSNFNILKLIYVNVLIDFGFCEQAFEYVESILSEIELLEAKKEVLNLNFQRKLNELHERLASYLNVKPKIKVSERLSSLFSGLVNRATNAILGSQENSVNGSDNSNNDVKSQYQPVLTTKFLDGVETSTHNQNPVQIQPPKIQNVSNVQNALNVPPLIQNNANVSSPTSNQTQSMQLNTGKISSSKKEPSQKSQQPSFLSRSKPKYVKADLTMESDQFFDKEKGRWVCNKNNNKSEDKNGNSVNDEEEDDDENFMAPPTLAQIQQKRGEMCLENSSKQKFLIDEIGLPPSRAKKFTSHNNTPNLNLKNHLHHLPNSRNQLFNKPKSQISIFKPSMPQSLPQNTLN